MKSLYRNHIILLALFFCSSYTANGQLTGTKHIPGDYSTITAAVTALNSAGVGTGGVIFDVAANHTETLTSTIALTATGTSSNPITFQKDPATTGSNPLITAYTGGNKTPGSSTQDGIWRLQGSDYVTINGIDLRDNPSNTTNPSTMEYGYALYKASSSNGCQYVTIENCTITLNNINNATGSGPMVDGSAGIIVMNATATAATSTLSTSVAGGTNSYNKFYHNTIQKCNTGIALIGYAQNTPGAGVDEYNDVGGSSSATGNTIINFGGASGASNPAVGIRTLAEYDINIGYNTINSNNGSGANHPNVIRGIYTNTAKKANETVIHNTITIKCSGTTQAIAGIENVAGATAASNTINISNNTITNSTYSTATSGSFTGIYNNAANPAELILDSNTISSNTTSSSGAGYFYCIYNTGKATDAQISGNTINGNHVGALTTGLFCGIYNTANITTFAVDSNTITGSSTSATTGSYLGIYNTGSIVTSFNIDYNNIGNSSTGAVTFSAANSADHYLICNTKGAATCSLSVSHNNFQGVTFSTASSASVSFIYNSSSTLTQDINYNTFTNLSLNTTDSVIFIYNDVRIAATGIQNVNNNSISGTFSKTGSGGDVILFQSTSKSTAGGVINNNNNNFSNITVSGATTIDGWVNTDAGAGTKTINNNTFSSWSGGTGYITAMTIGIVSTANTIDSNTISNITSSGNITGILTTTGSNTLVSNNINTLTTSGDSVVTGILAVKGCNIYQSKIYGLQAGGPTGSVNGILVSGNITAINIVNNIIGDLRMPTGNSTTDQIRGINILSINSGATISVYYNTIYLNATSSGTDFSTTGVYHTTSGNATTSKLDMRNNIIINASTPNGAGLTVAYRRSSTNLSNYASTSDNNLFYAGAASASQLIFYDGTNSDMTLSTYQARVSTRDASSVTEDLSTKFISTTGSSASYLHMSTTKPTQVESGGSNIAGYTTDFDGNIRQGNTGYSGTGTSPDIGADEFEGVPLTPMSGTYTVGTGGDFTSLTKTGGLFANINTIGLSGNVTVKIISDLSEDGTNALYKWAEQGAGNYTLTIQPDTTTSRLISGNVASSMITLNGVANVTFNGSFSGSGNYLTFRNTNTSGTTGTAFTFINGANNNTLTNCNVEAYANATNGVILFSTSTGSGNSNNLITNCNINATVSSNTGNVCIYSAGTTGNENTSNTISNNNIYNYRDRAIDILATGSQAWTISGNNLYNGSVTSALSYAAGSALHGIRVLGGSGYTIQGNYIGGSAAAAGGTVATYKSTAGMLTYRGILLTTTSASPASSVKGNTIANLSVSAVPTSATPDSVFTGIETNGSGITIGGTLTTDGNTIGSASSNSSIAVTTTTSSNTYKTYIYGINCNSSNGSVYNNTISSIDIKNIGTSPAASAFIGINISAATAPSSVSNNTIGGTAVNSIRVLTSSTSTTSALTGINLTSNVASTVSLGNNTIQHLSHQSTTSGTGVVTGISSAAVSPATISISNNIIAKNVNNQATGAFYGINSSGNPSTLTISGNSVSNDTSAATGAGLFYGIYNTSTTSTITISTDTISGNKTGLLTTGLFAGIYNTAAITTLNITSNVFYGNNTTATSGIYHAIYNTGAVTSAININTNIIGLDSTTSADITFNGTGANTAVQTSILNTGGTSASALSVSNNTFQGVYYSKAGTGPYTFISNVAATKSQTINNNVFSNIRVNTSGNDTFISNNVIVPSSGTQNVNNNSISGSFTKAAGGTLVLFNSNVTDVSSAVINNNSNNFSNINVSGSTVIAGWVNTDAGTSTKNIQNNTFSNWTAGSGAITVLTTGSAGTSTISGNSINNIATSGAITGINSGAGNDNIYSNTIDTLYSSGASVVTGIASTAATTKSFYKNKIYDLQAGGTTGSVNGILVSGTTNTTITIYNNIIGDLRVPAGNSSTDLVRGISITETSTNSSVNVYYNTIYLRASSTGTNFSTSCIYHVASTTSTTATLTLRNNILANYSTQSGTGLTVALRRSATTLSNFSTSSNNNLLYAGTPATRYLIYYNGTNSYQTLSSYQTAVSTRETLSVTEAVASYFLSDVGASTLYLHIDPAAPSLIEGGAVNISGITDDFDGQIRAGNHGYQGTGNKPDIGADEVIDINETIPPVITYTLLTDTTSTVNRDFVNVSITDNSGVDVATGTRPRVYYKRLTDANTFVDNTSATNGWKYVETGDVLSPFTFTIDYSLLYQGAAVTAGVIEYFVTAQDIANTPNIAINSGTFSTAPTSVNLTASAFPLTGTINSYKIPFSGTYNVGSSEIFTSLTKSTGLFAAINTVGLSGNVIFNVTSDLSEDGTDSLNQWTEYGTGNYTMTIQPDGTTIRNITGNVVNGLITLNGADRLTINGANGGSGSYLLFKNTDTTGTTATAFTFTNGASNDTLRNCSISAYANATNGVIFFNTATSSGNSYNLISNCDINATVGSKTGSVGIYSGGTTGFENSTDIISNNNIFNYRDRGLDISATGSTGWTISNNNFYNGSVAGSVSYTTGSTLHGIRVLGGSGYTISGNSIGGSAAGASGTNASYNSTGDLSYQGILLTTTSASPASNVTGNTISNISLSSVPSTTASNTFTGIETNGSGINIGGSGNGNTIGSNSANGAISVSTNTTSTANTSVIKGISCNSSGGIITANKIGGFDISNKGTAPAASAFTGIYVNNASAPSTVHKNTIGSTGTGAATNSIRVVAASTATTTSVYGIVVGPAVASSLTIDSNTIQNISNLSTTSSGSFTGISNTGSGSSSASITANTITSIATAANSSTGSTTYTGISASAPSTIGNNTISSISLLATGTAAQVTGISASGAYAQVISGNTLSSFTTSSAKTADIETGSPSGYDITGILNAATVSGQVISGNNLSGFNANNSTAVNTAVTGIAVVGASSAGNIYNNRVSTFTNTATGTSTYPGISGITATAGSFNVYNNSIRINNSTNTNAVKIYGINHAAATAWNYYYNSIRISGSSTGACRSAAFLRSLNGTLALKDNIFANIRTSTGNNYGISNIVTPPATNWASTTADYNDIYSISTATAGEWGTGVNETFAGWKTASGGDAHSVNTSITITNSTTNLQPDSTTNCQLNNAGTPITTPVAITTDINGLTRSGTKPDLGAYEFTYNTFTVHASSNSPVCAGGNVSLSVDIGTAVTPTYTWVNPLAVVVDTTQNPNVAAIAGSYKVTVTDVNGCSSSDSTTVALITRPTGHLSSSVSSLCSGDSILLNITVTGADTVSGTLSDGENFSGFAGSISFPISPDFTTTYSIISLSDSNCTSLPADIPDSLTINVTHPGDWLGTSDNDWNNPANWCGGIPGDTTNVIIYTGSTNYPVLSSGTGNTNDLTLQSGTSLTVSGATLYISGNIYNSGTFTATDGTVSFNGDSTQVIPSNFFSGNTVANLTINNSTGVILDTTLNITGVLSPVNGAFNTNNYLTLVSTSAQTALIDGAAGTGTVTGNVIMQRYLPSAFGYRYVSSPFQAATVNQLSGYIDLSASFPLLYTYDENKVSSGWTSYVDSTDTLAPLKGYAANFGTSSNDTLLQLNGTVNNGTISTTLYNHNQTYTTGFNLVGNPYPSPIDWNASSGLTRTNIDNAVYYFNPSTTDQYGGTYSSYINGISSDGVASNIIPAMQGFFVHVTDGSYPVTATFTLGNAARVNNLNPVYHRPASYEQIPILRIAAQAGDDTIKRDAMVIYFNDSASDNYDKKLDALKLINTDAKVPSLYAAPPDNTKLSINAVPNPGNEDKIIPLTIETHTNGPVTFSALDIEDMPYGLHPFFVDAQTKEFKDLQTTTGYRVQLNAGKYEHRFYIVFSNDDVIAIPGAEEKLIAYSTGQNVFVYVSADKGTVVICNALGQVVTRQDVVGKGYHYIPMQVSSGVYIITLYSDKGKLSKKLFIGSE